jgi:hypothetical protein
MAHYDRAAMEALVEELKDEIADLRRAIVYQRYLLRRAHRVLLVAAVVLLVLLFGYVALIALLP